MGLRFTVGLPGPFSYSTRIGGRRKRRPPAPRRHSQTCRNGDSTNCRRCREDAEARKGMLGCLGVVAVLAALGLVVAYWRIVLPTVVIIAAIAAYRPLARWFQQRADTRAEAVGSHRAQAAAAEPTANTNLHHAGAIGQPPPTGEQPAGRRHARAANTSRRPTHHGATVAGGGYVFGPAHHDQFVPAGFPPLRLISHRLPSGYCVLGLRGETGFGEHRNSD